MVINQRGHRYKLAARTDEGDGGQKKVKETDEMVQNHIQGQEMEWRNFRSIDINIREQA